MRMRICSAGHNIVLHSTPNDRRVRAIMKNLNHKYAVVKNDAVLLYEGNGFAAAENAMARECKKEHAPEQRQHGPFKLGKHRLVNGRVRDPDEPNLAP